VQSFSYGLNELRLSTAYKRCLYDQALLLTSRGVTIVVASGDDGVHGDSQDEFPDDFLPVIPASLPWVLSVGGTKLVGRCLGKEACSRFSGGGFSNAYSTQPWQSDAVADYEDNATLPSSDLWNRTGRGYPDLSVLYGLSIPYCFTRGSEFSLISGTSVGAPIVAGMIAILNDIRLSFGGPPFGFINPWLYQTAKDFPEVFNDITSQSNRGTGAVGFNADLNWDPCTGIGTPIFESLANIVLDDVLQDN